MPIPASERIETKAGKRKFVRELSKTIADEICEQIDAGLLPAGWDGVELRALLHLRHKASHDMCTDGVWGTPPYRHALDGRCRRGAEFYITVAERRLV